MFKIIKILKSCFFHSQFSRILLIAILLTLFPKLSCATNTVECATKQYIRLKGRAVIECESLGDFPSIYWYNNTNSDASALIQKVNGEVAGIGYTTGEFNIDNEGCLVINNVTIQDEGTFRVTVLDSTLRGRTYDITIIVYAEPAEPLPVIPECFGQSTCIFKRYSETVITCIHGESRPAMEVSWSLRVGRQDRRVIATVNQTVSADSLKLTTSALLAVENIPIDANMNPLLVLVCKSSLPIPSMNGSAERIILLDFTVDVPFTNEEHRDPVYATERQKDLLINCQLRIDTENNIVLWMYKSLDSENFENLLYSAFGKVTFFPDADAQFNFTNDGALVIKQVEVQHEGYYACVISSKSTTESFVQHLEVIVLPKPPRIVVEGCEPFQPCHLRAQGTVTCIVNGVRPQVDLTIVIYSMNVAVMETTVNSHREDGLFYMTVKGHVDVSEINCGKNLIVICQARGPAAYGFISDVLITIQSDGKYCAEPLTPTILPDDDGRINRLLVLTTVNTSLLLVVAILVLLFVVAVIVIVFCYKRQVRNSSTNRRGPLENEIQNAAHEDERLNEEAV